MDFGQLEKILQDHTSPTDKLSLPPAALESKEVTALFATYLAGAELQFQISERKVVDQQIQLKGEIPKGTFGLFQRADLSARAEFFVSKDAKPQAEVVLTLELPADYRFTDSFPVLAGTPVADLAVATGAKLELKSTGAKAGGPGEFGTGLSFSGSITGLFASVSWLLGGETQVDVKGSIGATNDGESLVPGFDVTATATKEVQLGPFKLTISVEVASSLEKLDNPKSPYRFNNQVALTTELTVGSAKADFALALGSDEPTLLGFALVEPVTLGSLADLGSLVGGVDLTGLLPSQFALGTSFTLTNLLLVVNPVAETDPLTSIEIGVKLDTSLTIVPRLIELTQVSVQFRALNPLHPSADTITADFAALFVMGSAELGVAVSVPSLVASGWLADGTFISANEVLSYFFGSAVQLPNGSDITVYQLSVTADARAQTYGVIAGIAPREPDGWKIDLGFVTFALTDLGLDIVYSGNALTGTVNGSFTIDDVPFVVSVSKPATDTWIFQAGLAPGASLSLSAILRKFLPAGIVPSQELGITDLGIEFSTNPEQSEIHLKGRTKPDTWNIEITRDLVFKISGSLDIRRTQIRASGKTEYTGEISGALAINSLKLAVTYAFSPGTSTFTFQLTYRSAVLTAVLSSRPNKKTKKNESILTVRLGGVSFGEIVEYLVDLVDPSLGFRLSAPWDVLYQLRFDNLSLEINLTTKAVTASYAIQANLGIVNLESISLTYLNRGGRSTVEIGIKGNFVGQDYTEDDPLKWDLLNESPPTPSGKGEQLLDLRYLGLGQNITFRDTASFNRVVDVINALETDFLPVDDTTNPLTTQPKLKFSGDGRWLIGADFTVMSAVSLMGVFNDPVLYGLRVGLAGPRVKSLAGLQFEVLYKKITDTIGVYHIELTLPDSMRQLQFGAVAVTVPIIDVDIYTNGNFRLNFGFPVGTDFSRSFCLQAGPFTGYGGFYFALLDGATSTQVPPILNGNFSPVIEFGLALSIGLGRTIDKGPLSAGATITAQAIVEGVFGWFNPDDKSAPTDLFYRVQGTAAIVGKVYGKVDFVVIKIAVSVTAYASATLIIESYAPITVEVQVGVEVSASLEILFITVHFSFEATLDFSFQIGEGSTPPWIVGERTPAPKSLRLGAQRSRLRRVPLRPREVLQFIRQRTGEEPQFDWAPRRVVAAPASVSVVLTPALTPAFLRKVTASLRAPLRAGGTDEPAVQVVMALFVPTSTPPTAQHAADVRRVTMADPEGVPFNVLCAGMLRWALSALQHRPDSIVFQAGPAGEVTIAELDAIGTFLQSRQNRDRTFTYENVTGLIRENFRFVVTSPLGPYDGRAGLMAGAPTSAAIFPMIPDIVMTPSGQQPVPFLTHAPADQAYRNFLETYYSQLDVPTPRNGGGVSGLLAKAAADALGETSPSLSTLLFCDYFGLLTQHAVQAATDLLNQYPYEPTGRESLSDIVRDFGGFSLEYRTKASDTPSAVAAAFGVPLAALHRVNPWLQGTPLGDRLPVGSILAVTTGPTTSRVAQANADYPLRPGATLPVSPVQYQLRAKNTLNDVVRAFGVSGPAALLADPDTWVNATNSGLLRANASLAVPGFDYVVTAKPGGGAAHTLAQLAANFYTRTRQRHLTDDDRPLIDWYVATIGRLNSSQAFAGTVTIPVAHVDANGAIVQTDTILYTLVLGDTVPLVAAMFELLQMAPGDPGFVAYSGRITTTPPGWQPGTIVHLPAVNLPIAPGDSFASLASLLQPAADDSQGGLAPFVTRLAVTNAAADVFEVRAVLALPVLDYRVQSGDTLGTVAAHFDLTVEQLAESVATDAGIFTPYNGRQRMMVPDVAARAIDRLITDLTRFGSFNSIAANVSRLLLNGMRAPVPKSEVQPVGPVSLWGLYDVGGQQFPAPSATAPYPVVFAKGTTASWYSFAKNPGPSGPTGVPGPAVDELVLTLTAGFFAQNRPSLTLDPLVATGPAAMRLYDRVAPRYTIEQPIPWQPGATVQLPGPTGASAQIAAGGPSVWLFPPRLLQTLAAGPSGPTGRPYDLVTAQPAPGGGTVERTLRRYSWATAVPLRITRALGESGAVVPNTYQVSGADQDGRDLLLKTWSYLERYGRPNDQLYLLYRPSAGAENNQGLVSDVTTKTFLLKANLSTETHSNLLFGAAASAAGDFFAPLLSPGEFLKYAWQASITGTGGFYLTYSNAVDGNGLPNEMFAGGGATIWALLLLDQQSRPTLTDRAIYPFNNCAVVAENLDQSATRLLARLAQPKPADYERVASTPPGVVGFGLARHNPMGVTGRGPTGITRRLHSLVGFQVLENNDFTVSHESLPLGPVTEVPEWMSLSPGPTANSYWIYQQTVPIAQFGHVNSVPSCPALPPAKENPYRGITGPTGPNGGRPLSRATLNLAYHDVYGNTTATTQPLGEISVPVGYTDALIGVAAWPGAAFDYLFVPGANAGPGLQAAITLQTNRYVPGGGIDPDKAAGTAKADAARYAEIFYQVQQPDAAFALTSNLGRPAITAPELKAGMLAFVTKAKLFADTAATLKPQTAPTIAGESLAACATRLAVTPVQLLQANADASAGALFPIYLKPHVVVAPAASFNTLSALARQAIGHFGVPPSQRVCTSVGGLGAGREPFVGGLRVERGTQPRSLRAAPALLRGGPVDPVAGPVDVATDNAAQPLTPGITLRVVAAPDEQHRAVPDWSRGTTLADGAARLIPDGTPTGRLATNVYAQVINPQEPGGPFLEVGIVPANWAITGLYAAGAKITISGVTFAPGVSDSFSSAFDFFNNADHHLGLQRGEFALALADIDGLVRTDFAFHFVDLVVPAPVPVPGEIAPPQPTFALQSVPAATADLRTLATLNEQVPNFFLLGAPLLLGYECVRPGEHDTPSLLAQDAGITLGQFAAFNALTHLGGEVSLTIPNLATLPDPANHWIAYSAKPNETLAGIADRFHVEASSLARVNRALPGFFEPGARVVMPGESLSANPLDSLDSLYGRFAERLPMLTFDQFVTELAAPANEGIYRRNGAVVTPLPVIPTIPTAVPPQSPAFETVAEDFGVNPTSFLEANRSLQSFLCSGAKVLGPVVKGQPVTIDVGAFDTIDTVIRRINEHTGVTITVADLARANQGRLGLLTIGQAFFLPPSPSSFAMAFAAVIPPPTLKFEDRMLFPVQVSVTLTRSRELVHPDFNTPASQPVYQATNRLAPRLRAAAAEVALQEFATSFEAAFADVPLACAVARRNTVEDSSAIGEIWAVNFGPAGIAQLAVNPNQPKFYSLAPLSTETLSGDVAFQPYVSGTGLVGRVTKHFDAIDLDAWMRQFLQTVDRFLTPPYCVPAFQMGATAGPRGPRPAAPAAAVPAPGPVGLLSATLPGAAAPAWPEALGASGATASNPLADFDRIVAAKQDIADALRERVQPILDLPNATDRYEQESARETLYQQMLVQLSAAYETTAIVQFPVDVTSPFPTPPFGVTGPTPPRASGQVAPALYRIPPALPIGRRVAADSPPTDSLAGVAGHFGVSPAYLAEVIFEVQGVLGVGLDVSYEGSSHPIAAHDTIKTVAVALGAPHDPFDKSKWDAWTRFIAAIASESIFGPAANFPVSRAERKIYFGETFATLGEFFALDLGSIARSNQDLVGLITPGPLTVGSRTYPVKAGDTLVDIARGLEVTIDDLAVALRNVTRLRTDAVACIVDSLPDIALSTAKVSLGRIATTSGTPPPLNFLLTVKQAAQRNKLLLNLDYVINEIEYAIRDVPGAGKYQASSWLTLVRPRHLSALGVKTDVAQVQIPVPLRAYPPPSVLVGHSGVASEPAATTIPTAREWDYRFDVLTTKAAQDTDHIRVTFGERPSLLRADFTTANLFPALAGFIDAQEALNADLARLLTLPAGAQDPRGAAAVTALSFLAQAVAGALKSPRFLANAGGAANILAYQMTTATSDGNVLRNLTLTPEAPGPTGTRATVWPNLLIQSASGPTSGIDAGFLPLPRGATGGFYTYPPDHDFIGDQPQTYRFRFEKRDVIRNASGRGAMSISRNDRLVTQGPLGPVGTTGPIATNDDFVYRTPFVQFVNPLIPLVDDAAPISISALQPGPPLPLRTHVLNLLRAASDVTPGGFSPGQHIELLCSYAFPLAGGDELVAQTPILLMPNSVIDAGTVATFADLLVGSVEMWRRDTGVAQQPPQGMLVFELSVFSAAAGSFSLRARPQLEIAAHDFPVGATADALRPILRLRNLRLPMADIVWTSHGPQSLSP